MGEARCRDVIRWQPPREACEMIDRAWRAAVRQGWDAHLERKRTGLMLHTRDLPESLARALEDDCLSLWQRCCHGAFVAVRRVNGGVELRALGRDRGTAVLSLASQAPPGTLAAFVGDDVTDEVAFNAVRDFGVGIRVGADERPSIAEGRLASCDAVADFLEEWLRVVCGPASRIHHPARR